MIEYIGIIWLKESSLIDGWKAGWKYWSTRYYPIEDEV